MWAVCEPYLEPGAVVQSTTECFSSFITNQSPVIKHSIAFCYLGSKLRTLQGHKLLVERLGRSNNFEKDGQRQLGAQARSRLVVFLLSQKGFSQPIHLGSAA